ncbi:MAG: DinB family protein [Microlunatus sp.]|nr:DinB family protein [Microlunatus sp.]
MASIWLTSIATQYRAILDDLAIALRTCPEELWEESLYPADPSAPAAWIPIDPNGRPFEDEAVAERKRRAQGAVWRTASHTLFFTDADLSAMEEGWLPRPPLSPHDEDSDVVPPTYSRGQLLDYVDHCLGKVDEVFAGLTDDRAEQPVADSHRHRGTPGGEMLVVGLVHLQLHTAQIRAFLVTRGVPWSGE